MSDDPTITDEDGHSLAAEYVLGVLDAPLRRAAERRMAEDSAFRCRSSLLGRAAWRARQRGDAGDTARARLEPHRCCADAPRQRPANLWNSLLFWRWSAVASAALAAACLAVVYVAVVSPSRAPLVATLDASGRTGFLATIDPGHNTITIVPASLTSADQRALELWLIAPGDQPRSLGLIEAGRPVRISVPADLAGRVTADAALAVSIEPPGGSPTGRTDWPGDRQRQTDKFVSPRLHPFRRSLRSSRRNPSTGNQTELQEKAMTLFRITALSTVAAAAIVIGFGAANPGLAQMKNDAMMSDKPVTVGGAPMYGSKNIIQNAVNSKDHTTLVAAVKAAGLVDTLQGAGPFTVFAPTNKAFEKLPKGTVETLLKPENKGKLTGVLTYHVVAGRLSAKDLMEAAKKNGGQHKIKTVQGEELTVAADGNKLTVWDSKGNRSTITIQNVFQSNGVIHVVDSVLLPA